MTRTQLSSVGSRRPGGPRNDRMWMCRLVAAFGVECLPVTLAPHFDRALVELWPLDRTVLGSGQVARAALALTATHQSNFGLGKVLARYPVRRPRRCGAPLMEARDQRSTFAYYIPLRIISALIAWCCCFNWQFTVTASFRERSNGATTEFEFLAPSPPFFLLVNTPSILRSGLFGLRPY